jgi:putative isomerase
MKTTFLRYLILILLFQWMIGCKQKVATVYYPENILNYNVNPSSPIDRNGLTFSDQGAWFAYGFLPDQQQEFGFAGPYIMTEDNGVWSSSALCQLHITNLETQQKIKFDSISSSQNSYLSHLQQSYENESFRLDQKLFFSSAHSAFIQTCLTNKTNQNISIKMEWNGFSFLPSLTFFALENGFSIQSEKSTAEAYVSFWNQNIENLSIEDSSYTITLKEYQLKAGEKIELLTSQSFIFPEYDWESEQINLLNQAKNIEAFLKDRITEKQQQLSYLYSKLKNEYQSEVYKNLMNKCILTLQNNWRVPVGELKHAGLFPSYHYQWFHGFWAWDSWKHAAALAQYHPELAKDQIKVMYDYMDEDGFIMDCIYRDTSIEKHNDRNTKPPLSAWAVWKVFEQDGDLSFLEEVYPKIVRQHQWWYQNRDHDKDGICEYGCTDGSLVAAKWESGMDNAVRFDGSEILQNSETAWSLNQESVDLNAYLYLEKNYLAQIAHQLGLAEQADNFEQESSKLKSQIQNQFFDKESGWFYDTTIDGKSCIKIMGCEGWIPLWAGVAERSQAEAVVNSMMNPDNFNQYVPLQTLSASEPLYFPNHGYWRGPVWIDQSYFGIVGLKNYGFKKEAFELTKKILHHSQGLLENGPSIRENYHPNSGEGMEAENFSWSAAHILLLLMEEPKK